MRQHLIGSVAFLFLAGIVLLLTSGAETEDVDSPQIRYHQAMVQLAELQLDHAIESNRKIANTFNKRDLDRLRANGLLARTLLENAKQDAGKDMSTLHVLHAEEWARIAERDYRAAVEVQERSPEAISAYLLEKMRLTAEIAKLRAELWKEPTSLSSLVDHMHWEMDRMSRDILDLQQRVEKLE